MKNIRNLLHSVLSAGWTKLSLYQFEMQQNDGTWNTQKREVYERQNAVAVLPYNVEKQTILLVKQLRIPAYVANQDPMLIEVCAGIVDAGETPHDAAIREAKEELGYHLENLVPIFEGFVSPGYSTETLTLFLAHYNDDGHVGAGGGLEGEGEDIEVLEVSLETAFEHLNSGRIKDMKTALLLRELEDAFIFNES